MKVFLVMTLLTAAFTSFADDINDGKETTVNGKKVIYTYKQFEKFDFDDLNIEGDTGAPSDLSISPIHEHRFTNRLPYRKSFTVEIKKGIERVR
jgi:hypothetical protein